MKIKVGVMGFGRMGRDVVRGIFSRDDVDFELVNINASGDLEVLAHLFKYDTVYGKFNGTVEVVEDGFLINGKKILVTDERDPAKIPWKEMGVDIVIDSTGAFAEKEKAMMHIKSGAKKVVLTSPGKDEDITIVMGVNDELYDNDKHTIISNASCTTNCLAPIAKVVLEKFGIVKGLMTTVHAYTNDQNIVDNKHRKGDLRRARAAAENIIPTSTGAAKAVGKVIPELNGKLTGFAMRVPVPTGSIVDVTFELPKEYSKEKINQAIKEAAEGPMKGILEYCEDPIVSSDIIGNNAASIFDSLLTIVNGNMVKLVSWYDNEWGYAQRVIDVAEKVARELK